MPHCYIVLCLIATLPQVSPYEQFKINAEEKRLDYAKWFNESNIETANLLDESKAHRAACELCMLKT